MRFEVDSSKITFSGKGIKNFFSRLNDACRETGSSYIVVGAFARDLMLENIFNQPTGIATKDIDVAIRVENWDKFNTFISYLKSKHDFIDGKNAHEFISPEGVFTDIIPFGKIEQQRTVSFPPDFDKEINMLGFQETFGSAIQVILDHEVEIKVVSIEGIAILKFIAWQDRQPEAVSEKHSRDISLIINAYFDAMVSEFASEFSDLFDEVDFDSILCGSRALGRRIKQISNSSEDLTEELRLLFKQILDDEDNSLFLMQFSNASNFDYPFSVKILNSLHQGFNEI